MYVAGSGTQNPETEWSYDVFGRDSETISEDSGQQNIKDPDIPGNPSGLSTTFVYEAQTTTTVTFDCRTAIEVKINHDVTAHAEDGTVYICQTKDTAAVDSSWTVYGWKLYVSVEEED